MISQKLFKEKLRNLWLENQYSLPEDVIAALRRAGAEEKNPLACLHFQINLQSLAETKPANIPLCGDTGLPVYYIIFGEKALCSIEGGIDSLIRELRAAVSEATEKVPMRANVVHPLQRNECPGNVGKDFPYLYTQVRPGVDYIEITAVSFGGGPELMGQCAQVLPPMTGIKGIQKLAIDTVIRTNSGNNCNPQVVGVAIGGSLDIATSLAKQAAVLRPVGDRHPCSDIAAMEDELLEIVNELDLGPWGLGGKNTILDVHFEMTETHIVTLPVAVYMHCPAIRRTTARFYADSRSEEGILNSWFSPSR